MRPSADGRRLVTVPSYLGEAAPPGSGTSALSAARDARRPRRPRSGRRFVRAGREILTRVATGRPGHGTPRAAAPRTTYRGGAPVPSGPRRSCPTARCRRRWETTASCGLDAPSARLLWTLPAHKSPLIALHSGRRLRDPRLRRRRVRWTVPEAGDHGAFPRAEARVAGPRRHRAIVPDEETRAPPDSEVHPRPETIRTLAARRARGGGWVTRSSIRLNCTGFKQTRRSIERRTLRLTAASRSGAPRVEAPTPARLSFGREGFR